MGRTGKATEMEVLMDVHPPPIRSATRRLWPVLWIAGVLLSISLPLLADPPDAPPVVSGITVDAQGHVLPGVEIVITGERPHGEEVLLRSVRSDERGRFTLGGLLPGSYRIVAIKGGYSVLVGKVDTLLRDFLEIVLMPSGGPQPPGIKPASSAWALRLPGRDRLESRGAEAMAAEERPEVNRRSPTVIELQSSRVGDGGAEGQGLAASLSGEVPITDYGNFAASLRHRSVGGAGGVRDDTDIVLANWNPESGLSSGLPAIAFVGLTQSRRGFSPALPGSSVGYDQRGMRVKAHWAVMRPGSVFEAQLEGGLVRGSEYLGLSAVGAGSSDVEFTGHRVALDLSQRRAWARHHEMEVALRLQRVAGGVYEDPLGRSSVTAAMAVTDGASDLGRLGGDSYDLRLADTWRPLRGSLLTTRWRVERSGIFEPETHIAASLGGQIEWTDGWTLRADAGMGTGADRSPRPSWSVISTASGEHWEWTMALSQQVGMAAWEDATPETQVRGPVFTDRSGRIRRLSSSATWDPGGRWPSVALRASKLEMKGLLAVGWAGDLPVTPLAEEARVGAEEYELLVDSPTTGTAISVGWTELRDEGDAADLLEGSSAWQRRTVQLRQRLGHVAPAGWTWHILVSVEQGKILGDVSSSARSARLALLDQRRVSGGVAMAF